MKVFFDSSAFAKRYIDEPGSDEVEQLCLEASIIAVSTICLPEIISALSRLKRKAVLTEKLYQEAKHALFNDLNDSMICNITPAVIRQAVYILEKNNLRAMDALHIGCALEWKADIFVTSDIRQVTAAQHAGIEVITV